MLSKLKNKENYLLKVGQQESARTRTRKQFFTDVFTIKYYLGRKGKDKFVAFTGTCGQRKISREEGLVRSPNTIYFSMLQ